MNEVIKTIYNRKSVRNFSQDAVATEDLKIIAEAGVWAPNSMNAQEWHFTVVTNPTLIEKMRNACKKGMIEHGPEFLQERAKNPAYDAFYHAPAVIVIAVKEGKKFDAGTAAMNMNLAAEALGYGVCITASTAFMFAGAPELREELDIPDGYEYACALSIGKEVDGPDDHIRDRKFDVISYKE